MGTVDSATVVSKEDPVWIESETQVLLCKASSQAERNSQLGNQLQWGAQLTSQARAQMEQMLLAHQRSGLDPFHFNINFKSWLH